MESVDQPKDKCVMVVHGRNNQLRDALFDFLRSVGVWPLEWSDGVRMTGKSSPYIWEVVKTMFERAQAAVVLLSPDDEARLMAEFVKPHDAPFEKELTAQPRPNVLIEAGAALAYHPDRTILVQVGQIRPASDIDGMHRVRLSNAAESRHQLVERLRVAGCTVSTGGTDWYRVGDFEAAVKQRSGAGTQESIAASEKRVAERKKREIQRQAVDILQDFLDKVVVYEELEKRLGEAQTGRGEDVSRARDKRDVKRAELAEAMKRVNMVFLDIKEYFQKDDVREAVKDFADWYGAVVKHEAHTESGPDSREQAIVRRMLEAMDREINQ